MQISFDEPDRCNAKSACCGVPEAECRPRNVGANHLTIGMRQVQRHLPGAAPNFEDASVGSDIGVQQLRKAAALGPRTE
jgi:hypothetical protein